jgi:hypothetical protein
MSQAVQLPVLLDKITTLKDGSFKVVFETRELSANDGSILLSLRNNEGWLTFSANQQTTHTIPEDPLPEFKNEKSQSQRLRAVLYRLWEQQGKADDFELFYRVRMERIINSVKEKLA